MQSKELRLTFSSLRYILARNEVSYCKSYVAYRFAPYTGLVCRIRGVNDQRQLVPRARCD